ncbi:MAG: dihydrofolate reductase family protein [Acidimicrobiales bacterium]
MTSAERRARSVTVSVYVGISVDGFLARDDGAVDFLDAGTAGAATDMGFDAFMASVDVLVMGRNTFDAIVDSGGDWPYGETPVMVLTNRRLVVPKELAGLVEAGRGDPQRLLDDLADRGLLHVYVDGGHTIRSFLRLGLIDELIITTVPVLVGSGVSLFGASSGDVVLQHVSTVTFPAGFVQTRYLVSRARG